LALEAVIAARSELGPASLVSVTVKVMGAGQSRCSRHSSLGWYRTRRAGCRRGAEKSTGRANTRWHQE
jgi:hypothetical protein